MNQSSGEAPRFELPAVENGVKPESDNRKVEIAPAPETSAGKAAPSSNTVATIQPAPIAVTPPIAAPVSYQTPKVADDDSSKLAAAEADRIEKEWIDKAKAIVARTQDNPREQNNEMGKVKADYIKRRFNKTIPTDDTVAV